MPLKPCHDLNRFRSLLQAGDWLYANIRRIDKFQDRWGWSDEDIASVLACLEEGHFTKHVLNCSVTELRDHEYVDADMYAMWVNYESKQPCSPSHPDALELSIKIAIVSDRNDELSAVVTFHPSGEF